METLYSKWAVNVTELISQSSVWWSSDHNSACILIRGSATCWRTLTLSRTLALMEPDGITRPVLLFCIVHVFSVLAGKTTNNRFRSNFYGYRLWFK